MLQALISQFLLSTALFMPVIVGLSNAIFLTAMQFPRLFTDQLDRDKAIQVFHRIADQAFATPSLVYSVLYYADREHLSSNGKTLYGETYLAYHHAAVPSWANHLYMTLCMPARDVGLYLQLRRQFLINGEGWLINRDVSARGDKGLSQAERDTIDGAVYWYRSASHRDIVISRRDASWQNTAHGQPIALAELRRNGKPQLASSDMAIPSPKEIAFLDSQVRMTGFSPDEPELGSAVA